MSKDKLFEKLASLYGLRPDYKDSTGKISRVSTKECQKFLKIIGVNADKEEGIEELIRDYELKLWTKLLKPVYIIKKSSTTVINIRIPESIINQKFDWQLEEEYGNVFTGKFVAAKLYISDKQTFDNAGTYFQYNLHLPINPPIGYHIFKVFDNGGNCYQTRLIIAPEMIYIPEVLKQDKNIWGPKIKLNKIKPQNKQGIADFSDLKYVIKQVARLHGGIVGIGAVNQISVEKKEFNPYVPSNRLFFNTLYLNTDEIINFIEDNNISIKLLSNEFQEYYKKLEDAELTDFHAIYKLKFKIFKILYNSFREIHMNTDSPKGQQFSTYRYYKGTNLRKLALFRALKHFFSNEDPKFKNWLEWPKQYQNPNSEAVIIFEKNNIELVEFYEFLQWQSDLQMASAGKLSFEKNLDIGIYVDIPVGIDAAGSEAWIHQDYYSLQATTKIFIDNEEVTYPVLLGDKLYEAEYRYFIDIVKSSMIHTGAVKFSNLINLYCREWLIPDETGEKILFVNYKLEDFISIIALESVKNDCLVIYNDADLAYPEIKNIVEEYGFVPESRFDFREVSDDLEIDVFLDILKTDIEIELQKAGLMPKDDEFYITKIPVSTYRLQFSKDFTFDAAKELVPYLKALGVSHVYSSPLLQSRKGSLHGYDVVNHNRINMEAGSIEEFYNYVDTLHYHGIGLICDIVPNHMGIGKENVWWMDVLENGQSSQYASYFDIDWEPIKKELEGKVLIPILGEHYGNILANGELRIKFLKDNGKLMLYYYEHEFPINPSSYPKILEHRLDILASRTGDSSEDFAEYLSIITVFKNLPRYTETDPIKITERNREKSISFKRLRDLCYKNPLIPDFIEENLIDFQCTPDDHVTISRLYSLLEEQAYRLAYWRVSVDEINYRRFFDVNDLAAICVENPAAFADSHNFILELIKQRKIDGLRVDHPDGLLDPTDYFKTLQLEISKRLDVEFDMSEENLLGSEKLPIYIVAEKITAAFEKLPKNWAVHGTVGYDFLNSVNNLFIDLNNEKKFTKIYHKFINKVIDFDELAIKCKKIIMKTSLTGELGVLSNYLNKISENYYTTRDYTLNSIRNALIEVISCFPVYRTYITDKEKQAKSGDYIKWAIGLAKKKSLITDTSIFDFIEDVLLLGLEKDKESSKHKSILGFAMKFQQYTGPLMAKGLEDTCFYRYNRLISLNEVGGEPKNFGISVNEFHHRNISRMNSCPNNMLTTSTHDTKRSEDVRARINVLSEIPEIWQKSVNRWAFFNRIKISGADNGFNIDKNDEYMIYQTLLGVLPVEGLRDDNRELLIERLENYALKAIREAKVHSSWVNINTKYEDSVKYFIRRLLMFPEKHPFWKEFLPFQNEIALRGYINSLSQCVLKLTAPGMPDIYQGCELWNFTLVDPDNRRTINYEKPKEFLNIIQPLLDHNTVMTQEQVNNILMPVESGVIKLFFTSSLLNFRQRHPELFKFGQYIPIQSTGMYSDNIVAFARVFNDEIMISVTPRLVYNLVSEQNPLPVGENIWKDTKITIPETIQDKSIRNIFTGEELKTNIFEIPVSQILSMLPCSVFYGKI